MTAYRLARRCLRLRIAANGAGNEWKRMYAEEGERLRWCGNLKERLKAVRRHVRSLRARFGRLPYRGKQIVA